jgi:hypothetical protein
MYRNKHSKVYQLPMDVLLEWRKHGRMLTLASGCRQNLSHAACLRTIHPVFSCPACRGCLLAFWRCGLERFPCILCPRRRNPSGRGPGRASAFRGRMECLQEAGPAECRPGVRMRRLRHLPSVTARACLKGRL